MQFHQPLMGESWTKSIRKKTQMYPLHLFISSYYWNPQRPSSFDQFRAFTFFMVRSVTPRNYEYVVDLNSDGTMLVGKDDLLQLEIFLKGYDRRKIYTWTNDLGQGRPVILAVMEGSPLFCSIIHQHTLICFLQFDLTETLCAGWMLDALDEEN